jgi:hypothetical protein
VSEARYCNSRLYFSTCRKAVPVREGFVSVHNCAGTAAVKDPEMGCLSARTFDIQLLWNEFGFVSRIQQ